MIHPGFFFLNERPGVTKTVIKRHATCTDTRINAARISQLVRMQTLPNLTLHVTTEPTAGTTCFSSSLMTFIIDFYVRKIQQKVCQNCCLMILWWKDGMPQSINLFNAHSHLNYCSLHLDFFA